MSAAPSSTLVVNGFADAALKAGLANPENYEMTYERQPGECVPGITLYTAVNRITNRVVAINVGRDIVGDGLKLEARDISPQTAPPDALPMPKEGKTEESEMFVAMLKLSEPSLSLDGKPLEGTQLEVALREVMRTLANPPPEPTAAEMLARVKAQARRIRYLAIADAKYALGVALYTLAATAIHAANCFGRLVKAVFSVTPKKKS